MTEVVADAAGTEVATAAIAATIVATTAGTAGTTGTGATTEGTTEGTGTATIGTEGIGIEGTATGPRAETEVEIKKAAIKVAKMERTWVEWKETTNVEL